jgi:tRNA-Thr(GGU) m(6)t(6)A37 methyltransferase TsaA
MSRSLHRFRSEITTGSRESIPSVRYNPIGIIHSPLRTPSNAPIQPVSAKHTRGTVEVLARYASGLNGLNGFSHIILLYHFHLAGRTSLIVKPFLDSARHGIFATRAPIRPNPIGISVVRLRKIRGRTIWVQDLDVLDETPLLDIKPYVPQFDVRRATRIGWFKHNIHRLKRTVADERFTRHISFSRT